MHFWAAAIVGIAAEGVVGGDRGGALRASIRVPGESLMTPPSGVLMQVIGIISLSFPSESMAVPYGYRN